MTAALPDIEIARAAPLLPMAEVGAALGIPPDALHGYGAKAAKLDYGFLDGLRGRPRGKLILVTAITPTPAGEGKTTTTVGLGDALNRIGKKAAVCIREPSLGPCFGVKGGAAGGGRAQVVPMEEINLHFTGDLHAVGAAHNLLSAMIDNHLHWEAEPRLDPDAVDWRRAIDMNDRTLRTVAAGSGGGRRGTGFDITAASEVMAVFCMARSLPDLSRRLGDMIVGRDAAGAPAAARAIGADGAMTVLLRDALMPNLVQTLENNPAFVHGGPFANIAHGCNSLMATDAALGLADYVVTEAGFGADLGAEKFFDIKCRAAGLRPDAAVVVATVRALRMHGGASGGGMAAENPEAVAAGLANLRRHVENVARFGVPPVVAVNRFAGDSDAEIALIESGIGDMGVPVVPCTHWADGSAGAEALARAAAAAADGGAAAFEPLYPDELGLFEKIDLVAREIYRAAGAEAGDGVRDRLRRWEEEGRRSLPVCVAKTPYSFSTDPGLKGAPEGHVLEVRDVRLSAGAGFVVAICGSVMTMPGLPRIPAARGIRLDAGGRVEGLF